MHRFRTARTILLACTVLCLAACSPKQDKRMVNFKTQGSRMSVRPVACVNLSQVSPLHSPAELLPGVRDCIYIEDYTRAAQLYGLAGLYGRIDVLRVEDPTAHEVISVLIKRNLDRFPQEQLDHVQGAIERLSNDSRAMKEVCEEIRAIRAAGLLPRLYDRLRNERRHRAADQSGLRPAIDLERFALRILEVFVAGAFASTQTSGVLSPNQDRDSRSP
jgi:hypothetical protein